MPDTKALFKPHFVCWRLLGMQPAKKYKWAYKCYTVFITVMVTVAFPLHLIVGFFNCTNLKGVVENLSISLTSLVCSMKTFSIWWRFEKVNGIFEIVQRQDQNLHSPEELRYVKKVIYPSVRQIIVLFYFLVTSIGVASEMSVLFNGLYHGEWRLLYETAYYPFDNSGTSVYYVISHLYQFFGVTYTLIQNMVNDTFAGCHLALLSGQVHLLSIRVARIGHDPKKSKQENNQELRKCILDHKDLMEYRRKLEDVISQYMFFQILFAGVNICVVMVYIMLFVKDFFTFAYYSTYLIGMFFEILPSCYYGTKLEEELEDMSIALYSCNWIDQDYEFRQTLKTFIEQVWSRIYVTAWLFRINNNSFVIACKNAYSLFALIMNMR